MTVGKGDSLFAPEAGIDGIFGVLSGGILLSTRSRDGLPVPGHIMRCGGWFGYGSILGVENRTLFAQANEPTVTLNLPLTTIARLRETLPGVSPAFALPPQYGEAICSRSLPSC